MQVLSRRSELLSQAEARRSRLKESHSLQQFLRDAEEVKGWLGEKLKVARDEAYREPSNLEGKLQQQQTFEAELQANKGRLEAIADTEETLVSAGHFAAEEIT